jgi:hypothetical protein
VLEGSEAVSQPAGFLDDEVDGFGAAVADPLGVEPGEDMLTPLFEGAPESGDLRDGAGRERGDDMLGDPSAGSLAWYMERSCW